MRSPRNIVFSPHVDDEVIGCFTALDRGLITDVVYFYDLDTVRIAEATNSAKKFGFNAWFSDFGDIPRAIEDRVLLNETDTIWCPTARDSHIQHAMINKLARNYARTRGCQLMFYTVDMNSFQVPLSEAMQYKKKAALAELFPSQSVLLADEKYHLFEGYSEKDHLTIRTFYEGLLTVKMKGYNVPTKIEVPKDDEQDEAYLNRLIVNHYDRVNVSTISVTRDNTTVEFNG